MNTILLGKDGVLFQKVPFAIRLTSSHPKEQIILGMFSKIAAEKTVVLPLNRMPSDRKPNKTDGESFDWGPFDVPDSDFGDTQITNWAIDQVKAESDKPKFLAVGYYRPHIPLWAPKRFFNRFADSSAKLPPLLQSDLADLSASGKQWALEAVTAGSHATVQRHKQWKPAVEAYLACVSYIDHELGRLIETHDQSDHSDNTWIVLWSDHGWHLGEKQHWGKWTGWERSTKVPLIIVPPKTRGNDFAKPGSVCHQPVSLLDLYPTLVEICNLQGPNVLDGQSLIAQLKHPGRETNRAVVTSFEKGNASLRTKLFRYIQYSDGSEELYNHQDDPNEWHNLASQPAFREIKASLQKRLAALSH